MSAAFPDIAKIQYEGSQSKNPLAFKHYAADAVIEAFRLWESIPDRKIELRLSGYYLRELADALINAGDFDRGIEILHWNARRTEWVNDNAGTKDNWLYLLSHLTDDKRAGHCAQIPAAIRTESEVAKFCPPQ